jgi:hypothetical protein
MRPVLLLLALAGFTSARAEDPPLSSFDDLLHRPLFSASRHAAAGAAATRLSSSSLRLTGLVTEAGRHIALIRSDEPRSEARIGPGASLNGWLVTTISSSGLDLTAAGQQRHVALKQMIPPSPE